jgi:hypothetical protein
MTLTVRFLGLQEDQKEQPAPVIKQQPFKVRRDIPQANSVTQHGFMGVLLH